MYLGPTVCMKGSKPSELFNNTSKENTKLLLKEVNIIFFEIKTKAFNTSKTEKREKKRRTH